MSDNERNEYMRNVKWSTALYIFASTISVVISVIWFAADIKAEIKDSNNKSKDLFVHLDRKIDSNQYKNELRFQKLEDGILGIKDKSVQNTIPTPQSKLFTEKWVNGKLTFIAVK